MTEIGYAIYMTNYSTLKSCQNCWLTDLQNLKKKTQPSLTVTAQ